MDLYTAATSWTPEQEQSFASIMAERKCSRIQAIHLYKRGNKDAPLTEFSHARSQPTERMADFAKENRLRLIDTGAEKVVPGKYGQLADMNDDGLPRLRLLAEPRGADMDRTLRSRRAKALEGGLTCKWKGDAESIFYFDPTNEAHVQLAVKLVGVKRRRVLILNDGQRQVLAARMAAVRARKVPAAA
jgi:hypothetical protein